MSLRLGPAAVVATASLALTAAACGSGGSSTASHGSAVGYSACVRSHGVPSYPDPDSSGQLPKTDAGKLGVSSTRYLAAQRACRSLLPSGGSSQQQEHLCMQNNDCSPAVSQHLLNAARKLARCMRSHGTPNFPDPTNGGAGGPWFDISRVGISDAESHTRRFESELDECARLIGEDIPESFG
jgi:hypothetical protein